MRLGRRARRLGQDGFSLIELVITVAILGIVVVALSGILIQYLRVSSSTQSRLSESTDQQFVSAYWQQDVSSVGLHDFDKNGVDQTPARASVWTTGAAPAGVPAGCKTGLPGTVVIGFAWNDYPIPTDPLDAWNPTVNAAVYVTKQNVTTSQWELVRVRCFGNAKTTSNTVARKLTNAPGVSCVTSAGAADPNCTTSIGAAVPPRTVAMTIEVFDLDNKSTTQTGYTTTLTANRRQG